MPLALCLTDLRSLSKFFIAHPFCFTRVDIFTGLDDAEVEALKDVFALSAPGATASYKDNAVDQGSSTSHAYRRLPFLHAGKSNEPNSSVSRTSSLLSAAKPKTMPKKPDAGHGFLSFMPSLLQEAAAAAVSSSSSSKNAAKKPAASELTQLSSADSQKSSSKMAKNQNASMSNVDAKPADSRMTDTDKASLNSWFKLLEHVNLFEDEAECLLPQDGRRTSLGDNACSTRDNSLTGTPVREHSSPLAAGEVAPSSSVTAQKNDVSVLMPTSAGGAGEETQPASKPAVGRPQYWLADDSAA